MRTRINIIVILIIASLGGWNCKEVYNPPAIQNNPNLLVVDGIVISGNDSTTITLSRTKNVDDSAPSIKVPDALVSVLGVFGVEYPLFNLGNGRYGIDQLLLDTSILYQLKVVTSDGNEFRSELSHVYTSPPIDSINWIQNSTGVHLYVSTHDSTNSTKYYRWEYIETWQYHSSIPSSLIYIGNNEAIPRTGTDQIYTCYSTQYSSNINVATSTALSSNIISQFEYANVPTGSIKLSSLYSNLVKQYGIPEEAYNFWENLKKNTEQLGSLFDLQPFTELGNIKCVNYPDVKCIGYISFTTETEKRIFISRSEVPYWNYDPYYGSDCQITKVPTNELDSYFQPPGLSYYPFTLIGTDNGPYTISTSICVDCTYNGGTNQKPGFWP